MVDDLRINLTALQAENANLEYNFGELQRQFDDLRQQNLTSFNISGVSGRKSLLAPSIAHFQQQYDMTNVGLDGDDSVSSVLPGNSVGLSPTSNGESCENLGVTAAIPQLEEEIGHPGDEPHAVGGERPAQGGGGPAEPGPGQPPRGRAKPDQG